MIQATLILCDFAQVAEGKLFVSGGGWTYTNRLHGHIGVLLRIPHEYAQRQIDGAVRLADEHGEVIVGAEGNPVLELKFDMRFAPGPNAMRGEPLDGPLAIPLPTLELPLGKYRLGFELDGEVRPEWELPFMVLEPQAGTPVRAF